MKKQSITLLILLSFCWLFAEEFDIKKFSDPDKYGWGTTQKFYEARTELYNRQKLLQIYEMNKQDITKNIIKSAIAPGWGHFSAQQNTKGTILLGIEIVLLGTSYLFYDQAMYNYDKYKKSTYIGDINQYYLDAKDPYTYSQIFLGLGIAVWLYTIYDSITASEEYNQKLWDDLLQKYHQQKLQITPAGISLRF